MTTLDDETFERIEALEAELEDAKRRLSGRALAIGFLMGVFRRIDEYAAKETFKDPIVASVMAEIYAEAEVKP